VIFDTDILIWIQRGNEKAAALVDKTSERYLSVFSQMELQWDCCRLPQTRNNTVS
jgi:predicted nucleic acid-binding protein